MRPAQLPANDRDTLDRVEVPARPGRRLGWILALVGAVATDARAQMPGLPCLTLPAIPDPRPAWVRDRARYGVTL